MQGIDQAVNSSRRSLFSGLSEWGVERGGGDLQQPGGARNAYLQHPPPARSTQTGGGQTRQKKGLLFFL
jgi:hypothetical protein